MFPSRSILEELAHLAVRAGAAGVANREEGEAV
jgi:hypothetical protein